MKLSKEVLASIYAIYQCNLVMCELASKWDCSIILRQKMASDATIYNPMFFDYD